MSLKSLLKWHKFTVQTNEHTGQSKTGALERRDSWINLPNAVNLNGHLQNTVEGGSRGKDNTIEKFGKSELELYWTLWHNFANLKITLNHRILIAGDPKDEILSFTQAEVDNLNIRIFQVISPREPVSLRRRGRTLFEVYLKQIFRQSL